MRVLALGDSVAETIAQGLPDRPGRGGVRISNGGTIGCGITTLSPYRYFGATKRRAPRCYAWQRTWSRQLREHRPDVTLIVVGRWEITDQQLGKRWVHIGEGTYDDYLRRRLRVAFGIASSTGSAVVFATTPYYHRGDRPDGGSWPEDQPRRADAFNRLLRQFVASEAPGASVVDLNRRTAGGAHHYVARVNGVLLRYDGVHFTPQAGRWLAPWLYPQLARAAARS